jgi:type II secretory pathway component PulK
MHVRAGVWLSTGLVIAVLSAACLPSESPGVRQRIAQAKQAGSWEGTGDRTIGFVSESGAFRVNWKTRNERPVGSGTFRLTVRSAISGRPIRIIADHRGEGSGSVDFVDDPRLYEFIVESANVGWWFNAEELQ